MAAVESRMSFLQPWSADKGNPYVRGAPTDGFDSLNYSNLEYPVKIIDTRPNSSEYDINIHGFAYVEDSSITEETLETLRANDKERVAEEYYPQVERLVKEKTGATKVVIFDHTLRRRDPTLNPKDNPNGREQPAGLVRVLSLQCEIQQERAETNTLYNTGTLRPVRRSVLICYCLPSNCSRSSVGAIRRVHRHLGDEADRLLQGRAQIIK